MQTTAPIKPFPKIWSVGSPEVIDLFNGEVEITEKIDGSQFAFSMTDEGLVMRSKGMVLHPPAHDKNFSPAVEYVESIKDRLVPGWTYYGETLSKPRHNALSYERVPKNHIALFGISTPTGFLGGHKCLVEAADALGIEAVALLKYEVIAGIGQFLDILETTSVLGKEKIEGVVIKNYHQYANSAFSRECFAKYVRPEFKERNSAEHPTRKNTLDVFLGQFRTEARWAKAVQHLSEAGKLAGSYSDIGPLIMEVQDDLIREEESFIREALWKMFKKDIERSAVHGLPEWYKKRLMEKQFS